MSRLVNVGAILVVAISWTVVNAADAGARADTPRDLLAALGFDDDKLQRFQDGVPVSDEEIDLLRQVLHHVVRFDASDLERWLRAAPPLAEIALHPAAHRGNAIRLEGRVRQVEVISPPPGQVAREPSEHEQPTGIYRVTIDLSAANHRAIVWCRRTPGAWQFLLGQTMDYPVRVSGLFLKSFSTADVLHYVCVADRVSWFPDRVDELTHVGADQLLLARAGMDIGLLDDVRHGGRIGPPDRECFYHMLDAMNRIDAASLTRVARQQFDIVKLLDAPAAQSARAYQFTGTARRAVRIEVSDPDIRLRFGIHEYFELDVFVPLPTPLKLVDPETGDSVLFSTYPMVFCMRKLPAGFAEGTWINEPVQVTGSYLKLWSFRKQSQDTVLDDNPKADRLHSVQNCPLFIGLEPQRLVSSQQLGSQWGFYAGLAFVVVLLATCCWIWQQRRRDEAVSCARRNQVGQIDLSFLGRER
jgi:hypothetical protein